MRPISRFVALDLRSLRPYAKNLIVPFIILFVAAVLPTRSPYGVVPALATFSLIIGPQYLFGNDERGRLDTLYTTLGISRRRVVTGRYATTLLLLVISTAIGLALTPLLAIGFHTEFSWHIGALLTIGSITIIGLVFAAELPFYFKLGATRARTVAIVVPPAVIVIALLVGSALPNDGAALLAWLDHTSPALIVLGALAITIAAGTASHSAANRLYEQRDL